MSDLRVLAAVLCSQNVDPFDVSDAQWPRVIRLAEAHDLLPALWSAGVVRGWWTPIPADALAQITSRFDAGCTQPPLLLQQAYKENKARNVDLLDQGQAILGKLSAESIVAVPLKGLHALLGDWWADPADRVMRDLDILVPVDVAELATSSLRELGYVPLATGHTDEADHELPAVHLVGRSGSVELHTALVVSRWQAVLPAAEVIGKGAPMSTTDAVIHAIAHAQLHDEAHLLAHIPLRSLHELSVLSAGSLADQIDWDRVRMAFRRASADDALDAHLEMARSLFGAAVPPPRGRLRAVAHDRLSRSLLERPRAASLYERTMFLPRGLSAGRMRELHGPGNVWVSRLRHVTDSILRSARSGLTRGGTT